MTVKRACAVGCALMTAMATDIASAWADDIHLEDLVVTANRRETELRYAPAAISVVTRKEIEHRGGSSIAELLRDVPGVQIDESSIPGLKRIRIRGEDARRTLVLIDGQETTDHTTYGPPMLIDPALIDRIEVVRGPQSVLYGSRAIGGVINIITKKAVNRPFGLEVGGGYDSATRGYSANGLASGTIGNFNYRLFAGRTEDYTRKTPSGKLPNTYYGTGSFDARLGYDDGKHSVALGYDRFGLSSQSSTPPGTVDGQTFTKFQLDMPQRDREKYSVFYEGKNLLPWMQRFSANAYHQTIDRQFTQDVAYNIVQQVGPPRITRSVDFRHVDGDTLTTNGANVQADLTPLTNHVLVVGMQYLKDSLDRGATRVGVSRVTITPPPPPVITTNWNLYWGQEASIASTSLYAQDTWSFAPGWQAVGGVRQYWSRTSLDKTIMTGTPIPVTTLKPNSRDDDKLIGSASLLWTPIDPLTLRVGWGQGYIVPTLLQLHTGTLFGSGATVRPNPNLVPETSNSYEFGARWNDGKLRLDGTLFHSEAKNYITTASCGAVPTMVVSGSGTGDCDSDQETTYTNINAAKTWGAEVTAGYKIVPAYEVYGTVTAIRRQFVYPTLTTWKSGVPLWSGRAGLRYEGQLNSGINWWWDAYLRGATSTEREEATDRSLTGVSLTAIGGWTTVNLEFGASWKPQTPTGFTEHTLSVALTNIGNVSYRSSLEELEQAGRAVRVNLRSTF
jgi:hemoglobin/transferrin/lactoferrin receptor protein